ncbi:hypothetical protein [Alteromonas gilva]|uniref:Uncharacterized protein n=1 Tax=Alteromonas gilva TaxID=2987522 RepID=A0ABT5L7H5_9ALTE|nr:hypothetical protein [Alteromonas gilva]MDC8832817.1 hypothetical protein [Alteromonas gilva]
MSFINLFETDPQIKTIFIEYGADSSRSVFGQEFEGLRVKGITTPTKEQVARLVSRIESRTNLSDTRIENILLSIEKLTSEEKGLVVVGSKVFVLDDQEYVHPYWQIFAVVMVAVAVYYVSRNYGGAHRDFRRNWILESNNYDENNAIEVYRVVPVPMDELESK